MKTLAEIKASDKEFLFADDIADYLEVAPHSIRCQAQTAPHKLGFPVIVVGTRVKIPRLGFIRFIEGGRS
ncbi:MAG: hypothetical protein Q4C04_04300 [Clostridia bacterium]|nr:hypothetical protein [Clostridia bacterium]